MVIPRLIRQQSTKLNMINGLEQLQNKAVADYVPPLFTIIVIVVIVIVLYEWTVHQLTSLYLIGDLLLYPFHQELVLLVIHFV